MLLTEERLIDQNKNKLLKASNSRVDSYARELGINESAYTKHMNRSYKAGTDVPKTTGLSATTQMLNMLAGTLSRKAKAKADAQQQKSSRDAITLDGIVNALAKEILFAYNSSNESFAIQKKKRD